MLLSRLERPHLIRLTGAGFNFAWTTTKASAPSVETRQDEYIKEICSPGSYGLNPGRTQLDRADPLLILLLCPLDWICIHICLLDLSLRFEFVRHRDDHFVDP